MCEQKSDVADWDSAAELTGRYCVGCLGQRKR